MKPCPRTFSTLLIGALLAAPLAGCAQRKPSMPQVTINRQSWLVELATTEEQRYRGLSGRSALGERSGMLFVYPSPRRLDFCMRDCLIPLDIAFIGADMRVVKTYRMQVEPDLKERASYSSLLPAQYALEVAGGALERAGVREGDPVTFTGVPSPTKAQDGP
jgi:hypothetical protein